MFLAQIDHLDPNQIDGIDIDLIVVRIAEAESTEVRERATSGEAKAENMEEKVCGRVRLEEE